METYHAYSKEFHIPQLKRQSKCSHSFLIGDTCENELPKLRNILQRYEYVKHRRLHRERLHEFANQLAGYQRYTRPPTRS
jgi:hypothetical protein